MRHLAGLTLGMVLVSATLPALGAGPEIVCDLAVVTAGHLDGRTFVPGLDPTECKARLCCLRLATKLLLGLRGVDLRHALLVAEIA